MNFQELQKEKKQNEKNKIKLKNYISKNMKMVELYGGYYKGQSYCDHIQMSKTEITQKLYKMITGENPSLHSQEDLNPVDSVSNKDAIIFCNKLSEIFGYNPCYVKFDGKNEYMLDLTANGFRLPLYDEWFYAAWNKESFLEDENINYFDLAVWNKNNSEKTTHKVGSRHINSHGLCDLYGNAMEIIHYPGRDGYNFKYCGGDYTCSPLDLENKNFITYNEYGDPDYKKYQAIGLRIVRNLDNDTTK